MATDATGTPTSPDSIPTYNTSVDAPSGLGFNAAMTAIQTALSARAWIDGAIVAGTRIIANKLLSADANQAFRIMGNGKLEWGAGGASALDSSLERVAASSLQTNSRIIVSRNGAGDEILIGKASADSVERYKVKANGEISWGAGGATPMDTQLSRTNANELSLGANDKLIVGSGGLGFSDGTTQTTASGGGTGAFAVRRSTNQTITGASTEKVQFATEDLDSSSWFDSATNHRYTPLTAGWYNLQAYIDFTDSWNDAAAAIHLYKNGSLHRTLWKTNHMVHHDVSVWGGSALVQANGSTDYFEVFVQNADIGRVIQGRFEGWLVKAS
jgi:hypothetical protein